MIALAIVPDVIDGTGAASIEPTEPLLVAARRLATSDVDALAIQSTDGRLLGLIETGGIVAAIAGEGSLALQQPVGDWAQPAPDWLAPGDSALDALELMRLRQIDHLPVLDDAGRLVGIVGRRRLYELLHAAFDVATDARHAAVFGLSPKEG